MNRGKIRHWDNTKWPFGRCLEVTAVGRFLYESLTLNLARTFFTDRKSGGGRCAEVTVIRGSTVVL